MQKCLTARGSCSSRWWDRTALWACPTTARRAFSSRQSAWPSATRTTPSLTWLRECSMPTHLWTPKARSAPRRRPRKSPTLQPCCCGTSLWSISLSFLMCKLSLKYMRHCCIRWQSKLCRMTIKTLLNESIISLWHFLWNGNICETFLVVGNDFS